MVKNPPAMQKTWIRSIPGLGRSPGGGRGNPTPVFLPGEPPWTEEYIRPAVRGSQRVGHNRATNHVHGRAHTQTHTHTHTHL